MLYEIPLKVVPTSKDKTSFLDFPWYGCLDIIMELSQNLDAGYILGTLVVLGLSAVRGSPLCVWPSHLSDRKDDTRRTRDNSLDGSRRQRRMDRVRVFGGFCPYPWELRTLKCEAYIEDCYDCGKNSICPILQCMVHI